MATEPSARHRMTCRVVLVSSPPTLTLFLPTLFLLVLIAVPASGWLAASVAARLPSAGHPPAEPNEPTNPALPGPALPGPALADPALPDPGPADPALPDPALPDPGPADPALPDPGPADPEFRHPFNSDPAIRHPALPGRRAVEPVEPPVSPRATASPEADDSPRSTRETDTDGYAPAPAAVPGSPAPARPPARPANRPTDEGPTEYQRALAGSGLLGLIISVIGLAMVGRRRRLW